MEGGRLQTRETGKKHGMQRTKPGAWPSGLYRIHVGDGSWVVRRSNVHFGNTFLNAVGSKTGGNGS